MKVSWYNYRSVVPVALIASFMMLFLLIACDPKEDDYDFPTAVTGDVSNITWVSASIIGEVTDEGGYPVTSKGFVWNSDGSPVVSSDSISVNGEGLGAFSTVVENLEQSTNYYIRAYATSDVGTTYGALKTFWTLGPPVVFTDYAVSVTSVSATIKGALVNDGGEPITQMGICYDTEGSPDIEDNLLVYTGTDTIFSFNLSDLDPLTIYYFRSFAVNVNGTSYGELRSLNTLGGYIEDIEGNSYEVVKIGEQSWITENLKVTKYNDNTPIDKIDIDSQWTEYESPAYSKYSNSDSLGIIYGYLYNWYAVNEGNLCPVGWHVATDDEWATMEEYLGVDAASKLKDNSGDFWPEDSAASNETNFSALPGGYRGYQGTFSGLERDAAWWSASENSEEFAWLWEMNENSSGLARNSYTKNRGHSVRCVKD